jgi:hypothetical protein
VRKAAPALLELGGALAWGAPTLTGTDAEPLLEY